MRYKLILLFILRCDRLFSQLPDTEVLNEQQIEEIAEIDENEAEDEYNLQQLAILRKSPLNINDPFVSLSELPLLTPLLVDNLMIYRNLLGDFISIYELQAVPGFTIEIIKKILPYITVDENRYLVQSLKTRFRNGQHNLITRPTFPSKIYFRYKYQYQNLLQFGALGERDAGERSLIDFYSFHFFLRNTGIIKSMAIGDFTVNLGQGLIHWQSQAFRKSSQVMNVKRQSEIIRPYHSAGEYNFLRGLAVTIKKYCFEATGFISKRKLSANISHNDEYGEVFTSINTSGLHRTEKELENKNNLGLLTYGINLKYQSSAAHFGFNAVSYTYSAAMLKRDEPYNLFAVKGNRWLNYGADYSYTYSNFHFFGEMAFDSRKNPALINGLMASIHSSVDISLIHRAISKRYQSIYGNAFLENTIPGNEYGIYWGVGIKPHHRWKLDLYADVFRFPWLKYRVDAPSEGCQYLIQANWKPDKQVELYSRFRFKAKPLNIRGYITDYPESFVLRNWRTHISLQLTRPLLLRNRVELCWFAIPGKESPETGYLLYSEIVYKPMGKWYSANARLQVFETADGYDTRIYAYENDVLFSSSTPASSGKGIRSYINIRCKPKIRILRGVVPDIGLRAAISIHTLSTPVDQVSKTEIRLQVFLLSDSKNL